jgi:hypothetical protein
MVNTELMLKLPSVLRIRNVYPGSEFLPSRIRGSKRHRISDSGSATLVVLVNKITIEEERERRAEMSPGERGRVRICSFKKNCFGSKTTIYRYLSLGLQKGRPSYRRSLQSS